MPIAPRLSIIAVMILCVPLIDTTAQQTGLLRIKVERDPYLPILTWR